MNENVIALIPLRGGSKGIPNKNIKSFAGKPLCYWVIEAAYKSKMFSKIIVSTDSEKITNIVHKMNLDIIVHNRPSEFATDISTTESVIKDCLNNFDCDILYTIQATSPLTVANDFIKSYKVFKDEKCDSLLTGVVMKRFIWSLKDNRSVNYDYKKRPRRQDFIDDYIIENGAFYITKKDIFNTFNNRLGGKIGIYTMDDESLIEIDDITDFEKAESLMINKIKNNFYKILKNIKLLVIDVDGTLTDSGMYYSNKGEELKKFNTKDGKGLELIRGINVKVVIITGENSNIVKSRAIKLNITDCFLNVKDKKNLLLKICLEQNINLEEVAYIGDDINDLECLKMVGFSACPADSLEVVKKAVKYICKLNGGFGAVRELCDLIINSKSK